MTAEYIPLGTLAAEFLAVQKNLVTAQGFHTLNAQTRGLMKWLEDEELDPLVVGIQEASHYMAHWSQAISQDGNPYASGSVHNQLKAARKFFAYLVATDRMKTNPFMEVDPPRHSEALSKNVLTEAQMGRLLTDLEHFDRAPELRIRHRHYRVHVIAEFLYSTGLRVDEACHLVPENLDVEARLVHVAQGKGGKPRTAFMTAYAAEVMKHYLKAGMSAITRQGQHNGSLFGACTSRILSLVNQELYERCRALELPVITTHGFRHSLGTHLLRSGCDMRHIQVILGHQALATTQIYTRVTKDDLKKSLDEFHPRKWAPRGQL